jgi:universal stress protein A
MSDFRHILVPVDFSEKNKFALALAGRLALVHDCRVTLLHVIETIEYTVDDEIEGFYQKLGDRSREHMHELIRPFHEQGVAVDHKTVMGNRVRGIVSFVMQNDIDLVVLSSHKVELNQAPKGWGSLSHQVSIVCPCSVLLVKN